MGKRNNLPAVLLAVLLFGLGAAVGALAHRYYSPGVVVASSPETFRRSYVNEMRGKVALTAEQEAQLQRILDQTRAEIRAVRERNHPEMMRIKQEQVARVKAILTPAQLPAYEKLVAERERRSREQEEHDRREEAGRRSASGRAH